MAEPREPRPDRPVFRARHRLSRATDFRQAYCDGARRSAGPITIYLRPNGLREHRLGLSVGRRVGGAVVRNRVKRLLREAFRLSRAELPSEGEGCDIVISVRPHRPLPLAAYRRLLTDVVARARRDLPPSGPAQERADAPG